MKRMMSRLPAMLLILFALLFNMEAPAQTAKANDGTPNGCPGEWISDCNIKVKEKANSLLIGNTVLWPNPSNNGFNLRPLQFSETGVHIRVMNAQGQVLTSAYLDPSQTFSFGESFLRGIYFLQLSFKDSEITVKVLKL